MSEMIDRVAKAIAETIALAHIKHNLREIDQEDKLEEYLKMFPIKVTLADSDVARAAIEAMRAPTEPMKDKAVCVLDRHNVGFYEVNIVWQAMVDRALKD